MNVLDHHQAHSSQLGKAFVMFCLILFDQNAAVLEYFPRISNTDFEGLGIYITPSVKNQGNCLEKKSHFSGRKGCQKRGTLSEKPKN